MDEYYLLSFYSIFAAFAILLCVFLGSTSGLASEAAGNLTAE